MYNFKVSIIILNWNGKEDTLECLDSVQKIDYPNFEVVVVDNGSSDNSVKAIQKEFPEVTVLETGENLGFAGGNNVGMRYALKNAADYILLLNNDTIVDSQILKNFIKAAHRVPQWGIFAAKIYYYSQPDKIWYAGAKWLGRRPWFIHLGIGHIDDGQSFNSITETPYASGCALFVGKTIIQNIGILDERFFCYFEETDFCYRARAAGFKSFVIPFAKVWHKVSSSSGGEGSLRFHYFLNRNILLWAERNLPVKDKLKVYRDIFKGIVITMRPPGIGSVDSGKSMRYRGTFEAVRNYRDKCMSKYKDPIRKAALLGVRDYLLRRFGNCPESVRAIGTLL